MAKTYEPIATTNGTGSSGTLTMSSIPSTYTDLVVVASVIGSASGADLRIQVNGDTATNYSITRLLGYTSATSNRSSSATYMQLTNSVGVGTSEPTPDIYQFQNYSNTTTYKTALFRHNQFQGSFYETAAEVGLWRSTAAINSISFILSSGNFTTSSTFTLYGIKAA